MHLLKLFLPIILTLVHDIDAIWQWRKDTGCSSFEGNGFSLEIDSAEVSWCPTRGRGVRGVASRVATSSWTESKRVWSSPTMPHLRVESGGQRWVMWRHTWLQHSVQMWGRRCGRSRRGLAYCRNILLMFWYFINRFNTGRNPIGGSFSGALQGGQSGLHVATCQFPHLLLESQNKLAISPLVDREYPYRSLVPSLWTPNLGPPATTHSSVQSNSYHDYLEGRTRCLWQSRERKHGTLSPYSTVNTIIWHTFL